MKKSMAMTGGWVNYSYDVLTNTGSYIVQILGDEYNDWKREKMKLQFAVLNHLKVKKFPYEVPAPLPILGGQEYISHLSRGRNLWVYKKIEGEVVQHFNHAQFIEAMKGLALFHKYTRDFKWPVHERTLELHWLSRKYEEIAKVSPKNRTDRLMLGVLPEFKGYLDRLMKLRYTGKEQIIHNDFNDDNILFRGDKLAGIIDFDNVEFAPVARDVALSVKRIKYPQWAVDREKLAMYAREYRKYARFSKEDEEIMVPFIIWENCGLLKWFYEGMKKHLNEQYNVLTETIDQTKMLAGWLGWE